MLAFALEWWFAIIVGLYIVCGYGINYDAQKRTNTIDDYYNDIDHISEEDKVRCERSKYEVGLNRSIQYIHMLLISVVLLLAGILVTLIKAH